MPEHHKSTLEPELPPGTVHILRAQTDLAQSDAVIFESRPSRNPDDPLNWTRRRKLLHIFFVYFYTFSAGYGGTATYSVLTDISRDTGITLTQLNLGTGLIFLLAGWANLFWQLLALSFGRRPVFLLSLLGCLAISEWTAWTSSFGQWTAGRILYGVFVAPVEVLPEVSIPDVFFAHERGTFVGLYSLDLNGSNFIAPFISGFINYAFGWSWVQHCCAVLMAINLILAFFFQEESIFGERNTEADPGTDMIHVEAHH